MTWRRRLRLFNANLRARTCGILLLLLTALSLTAEMWANDRPLLLYRSGRLMAPVFKVYPPVVVGQSDTILADYHTVTLAKGDWALWPPNRWGPYRTNKLVAEYPSPPTRENWFGTDDRGRDVFARLLYGFRYGLAFAVATWALCALLALGYGGVCGYYGRWIDLLGQRALEILSTVPQLLLLLFVLSFCEASLGILILVSCTFGWIGSSYLVRGEVLRTRAFEYVEASRALGAPTWRIVCREILPNCVVPLLTMAPFAIVANLTGLAGLDFLGLGLPPPTPSWGELMAQAQLYFNYAWWLAMFPSLALFLTLLSLTFVGEGVRSAFDPSARLPLRSVKSARRTRRRAWVLAPRASVFVLISFIASTARASSVDVQTSRLQATDPMDMSSTRLNFNGGVAGDLIKGFGLGTEVNEGFGRDVRYHGLKGTGHARVQAAPDTTLTLTSGATRLANEYPQTEANAEVDQVVGEDQTIPVYGAAVRVGPGAWAVEANVAHDYVYQDWTQPRAATGLISGTKFALSGELNTIRRVHVRGNVADVTLNDRNEQRTGEAAALVDVLDRRDRVRLGAGVWYDDLRFKGPAYWTPRHFASYTVRSETRMNLTKDFTFDVAANVGYGGERLKARDLNYALTAKIEYQLRAAWRLTVGCVRMEAFNPRGLSTWFRNDLYASLSAQL